MNVSRVISASWVGSEDQTQASGGLLRPPDLVARRFHTMYPVYLGLVRISRTEEPDQVPRRRLALVGSGGG